MARTLQAAAINSPSFTKEGARGWLGDGKSAHIRAAIGSNGVNEPIGCFGMSRLPTEEAGVLG